MENKKRQKSVDDEIRNKFQQFYLTKKGKKKQIKERDEKIVRKDYSSEASPYNEWIETRGSSDQGGVAQELFDANPDMVGEDQSLYYYHPQLDDELLSKVYLVSEKLTDKQKQVLQLVALEGKSLENCGAIMKLSRGNVLDILNRARKTIQAEIKKTSTKVGFKRIE